MYFHRYVLLISQSFVFNCVLQILKLEVNLLQAEQQRLRESEAVFQCRAEAASRVKHLRATIQVNEYTLPYVAVTGRKRTLA